MISNHSIRVKLQWYFRNVANWLVDPVIRFPEPNFYLVYNYVKKNPFKHLKYWSRNLDLNLSSLDSNKIQSIFRELEEEKFPTGFYIIA